MLPETGDRDQGESNMRRAVSRGLENVRESLTEEEHAELAQLFGSDEERD